MPTTDLRRVSGGSRPLRAAVFSVVLAALLGGPARAQDPEPAPQAALTVPAPALSLESILQPLMGDRAFHQSTSAMQIVNVRTGEEVFAREADRSLMPASTMKVLTTAAALKTLGPSYRYSTDLYVDGRVDAGGVLRGNLYVQGHGDPTLVVEKLWKLAYDLQMEGVERIEGDVVFDDGFMETSRLPGWDKPEDLEMGPSYFPSLSALSLNFNTVALVIGPGPEVGGPGRVRLETPAGEYIEIANSVTTGAAGSGAWLDIKRHNGAGTMKFEVAGRFPSGSRVRRYYRTVEDPTAHFAAAFMEMLGQQGIQVGGKGRRGSVPDGAVLYQQVRSPPLAAILMDMNKYSNNFVAEQVLRTVGAEVHGLPGTTAKGLQVVSDYLEGLGIDPAEFKLVNGSGLSRDSRLRPTHLTAVMVDMAYDPRVGSEFTTSLAIAGQDGTLWKRLVDDPGRLRGKTGTIDGVHCLSGYIESGDGEVYAFAFMANDIRGGIPRIKQLHDGIARRLFSVNVTAAATIGNTEPPL